jgi:putative acetyltransferase
MTITIANLDDPRVRAILDRHVTRARAETGRGSAHALDHEALRAPDITLWAIWDGDAVIGVGALKRMSDDHGEIKSMHTVEERRRSGAASAMLRHIIAAARDAGMSRVSLETGSWPYFVPARALYARFGFIECGPFGDYVPDPNSVFMTLDLHAS